MNEEGILVESGELRISDPVGEAYLASLFLWGLLMDYSKAMAKRLSPKRVRSPYTFSDLQDQMLESSGVYNVFKGVSNSPAQPGAIVNIRME